LAGAEGATFLALLGVCVSVLDVDPVCVTV
jgi:hypothetical protein